MEKNIRALISHQFADHNLCEAKFCGYRKNPSEKYVHRSLPYHIPLHDIKLRAALQVVFDAVSNNAQQYGVQPTV